MLTHILIIAELSIIVNKRIICSRFVKAVRSNNWHDECIIYIYIYFSFYYNLFIDDWLKIWGHSPGRTNTIKITFLLIFTGR